MNPLSTATTPQAVLRAISFFVLVDTSAYKARKIIGQYGEVPKKERTKKIGWEQEVSS
jgi:hypothetical protein